MGLSLEGIDDLISAFEDMKPAVDLASHTIADKGAALIQAAARANATVNPKVRTGALVRSISAQPATGGGAVWTSQTAPTVIYGRIQELGGMITAHGKYLSFTIDGQFRQVKSVVLPPRPYLAPALKEMAGPIGDLASDEWGKAVGAL